MKAQVRANPALAAETGDLLFAIVNLARHVGADPDVALRGTNAKFERRFARMRQLAVQRGLNFEQLGLEKLDLLWDEAKLGEAEAS